MKAQIEQSWKKELENEFNKPYFTSLTYFLREEYLSKEIYPQEKEIFSAFNYCSIKDVKVVIVGQDPYHGKGQANGYCFSVNEGQKHPPSLMNIFKEIEKELGIPYPISGDLTRWASQGVFLLNATLTVESGMAGSHQKQGWEAFTDSVIETINKSTEKVVFMLWGGFAKKKGKKINRNKHLVLESGHPSPLSANRGYWFGNNHFSLCNIFLKKEGKKEIDWK
jgi:uracil-DNA glycosylase